MILFIWGRGAEEAQTEARRTCMNGATKAEFCNTNAQAAAPPTLSPFLLSRNLKTDKQMITEMFLGQIIYKDY